MDTNSHHAIRLAGPWTLSLAVLGADRNSLKQSNELRINLAKPDVDAWQVWLRQQFLELRDSFQPNQKIQAVFARKFNQPTGITSAQRLSVEIEFAAPSFCDSAVEVNGQSLSGNVQSDLRVVAGLERLESFNLLAIRVLLPDLTAGRNDFSVPPFTSVRILITE